MQVLASAMAAPARSCSRPFDALLPLAPIVIRRAGRADLIEPRSGVERLAADREADTGKQLGGLGPGPLGAGGQHPLDLRLVGHELAVSLPRPCEEAVEQLEHRI